MKCTTCKMQNTETRVVPHYHADLLGAPFDITLINSVKEVWCVECQKKLSTTIPELEGLLQAVAWSRAFTSRKLSGEEVRFLRKAVGMKAKAFAEKIEMSPENLSRVENGQKPLGPGSEKLLRFFVLTRMLDDDVVAKIGNEQIKKLFDVKIESTWDPEKRLGYAYKFRGSEDDVSKRHKYEPVAEAA